MAENTENAEKAGVRVKVRIYGQDYTIAGDRDEETIRTIAAYVDDSMREIGRHFSTNTQGSLAVLTAINMAEELFDARAELEAQTQTRAQLEKDVEHYMQLWEEAKKSFQQHKEATDKMTEEKKEMEERYKLLQDKCSEFENSFFDLQMENIRLKNEMDKRRRSDE